MLLHQIWEIAETYSPQTFSKTVAVVTPAIYRFLKEPTTFYSAASATWPLLQSHVVEQDSEFQPYFLIPKLMAQITIFRILFFPLCRVI